MQKYSKRKLRIDEIYSPLDNRIRRIKTVSNKSFWDKKRLLCSFLYLYTIIDGKGLYHIEDIDRHKIMITFFSDDIIEASTYSNKWVLNNRNKIRFNMWDENK